MAYTTNQALETLNRYLGITDDEKQIIENTKRRGFVFSLPNGEKAAVFVYPLVHKQDNTKNYFDTRDSGAYERGVTWNYAITNNMKYFCIGVNDTVDKYNDYSFSLECNESDIEKISGTLNGSRNGSGNQIIIPNDYVPSKGIERIANKLGIYITAVHKDNLLDYLTYYDNRPYMENSALANLDELVVDDSYVEREDPFKTGYESPFPRNRILFGAPGTGKSFTINNKNMAKFMKSLYDRVIDGNYEHYYERFVMFLNDIRANDRMPTDKEFREALIYRPLYKKNICKYLLSVIENSTKEHIDVSNLTIEHILPQKENAAVWKKEVGADYGRVYETYLHTLGNLTITGHNSELGTKAFEEKKKIIRQNSKANILNREVLSADTWTEKSILHRAEILADILIEEFKYIEIHSDTNESTELTFDVNSNFDFSNTKPGEMIFVGEHTKVSSWADLLAKTMNTAFDLDAETITDLATKDYSIPYATRIYISNDERKIRKPKQIDNSGIYFEANLSANGIISFIKDLLAKLQLDTDDFSFSLSEVPFDIDNEDTWAEGLIPVAKLFYNFVENLVEKELIDSAELENLKTKEYTKKLFQATDYPAIANNRTDNMGNSLQKRYRAKAINFNGSEIYVSTQFFDSDRDAVIDWYRSHL